MTTLQREHQSNTLSLLVIFVLLFAAFSFWYNTTTYNQIVLQQPTISEIRILEVVSSHAWQQHGTDVNQAIKCLENNGSSKSFKTSFSDNFGNKIPTNVWLCFDGSDWYAVITTTFQKIVGNKVARLVTAYRVAQDIFPTIDDFINYIGLKWNAREIQYAIEAGKIILDPK